jgi:hypothetical protein
MNEAFPFASSFEHPGRVLQHGVIVERHADAV